MKIKTTSWHYLLADLCFYIFPYETLCSYIRKVFLSIVISVSLMVMLCVILAALVSPIAIEFYPESWDAGLVTAGYLLYGVVGIGLSLVILCRILQLLAYGTAKRNSTERKPSIVSSWYRAKKEKVCNIVEFE